MNWDQWQDDIHTAGVVEKIRTKYDAFMKAEYNVDASLSHVGHHSERMRQLEVAMTYNFALYLSHYLPHLEQMETVRNIGDLNEMSMLEMVHLMPGFDTMAAT